MSMKVDIDDSSLPHRVTPPRASFVLTASLNTQALIELLSCEACGQADFSVSADEWQHVTCDHCGTRVAPERFERMRAALLPISQMDLPAEDRDDDD